MPVHAPAFTTNASVAPGQPPQVIPPPPAETVTIGAYSVHAGEGTTFRRSDGRWIARVSVSVTNRSNALATLSRLDFAAIDGMIPWPAATTIPEMALAPGQSASGDVAFVAAAAPEAPAMIHLYVGSPNSSASSFVPVALAPGAPRRDTDVETRPTLGFFRSLRGTAPAPADVALPLALNISDIGTFRSAAGTWFVRAAVSIQNGGDHRVQVNRALVSALADDGPVRGFDAVALASTRDAQTFATEIQARYVACQTGYYQNAMPAITTLEPGQNSGNLNVCFERPGSLPAPAKLELRYGLADGPVATASVLVPVISNAPATAEAPGVMLE